MPSIDLGNVMGPQGPQGSIWYQGTAITGTSSTATVFAESGIEEARVYDKYFNTGTNDIYTCVTSGNAETAEWVWIGNIRGGTGPIGPVGPTGSVDMDTPITFTEAETMANIESGESVSIIFGKLKKIVGDMLIGAGCTLLGKKLTESKVLVSDEDGNVGVSKITVTELDCLDGVTKNVQEQFNEQNVKMSDPIKSVSLTLPSTVFTASTQSEATGEVASVVPDGYKAITAIPRHSMSAQLCWTVCVYSAGIVTARLRNLSSSDVAVAPVVDVLCVKNN